MSLRRVLNRLSILNPSLYTSTSKNVIPCLHRCLNTSRTLQCETESTESEKPKYEKPVGEGLRGHKVVRIDPVESIKYMKSEAYREMYGEDPVWKNYRKNHKGHFITRPRMSCIRQGLIATGSACPICRDDFLVFDYTNLELLQQFVDQLSGQPINPLRTGLCLKQYKILQFHILKAQDYGYLMKHFPFRVYNNHYYEDMRDEKLLQVIEDPEERATIERERANRKNRFLKNLLHKY